MIYYLYDDGRVEYELDPKDVELLEEGVDLLPEDMEDE